MVDEQGPPVLTGAPSTSRLASNGFGKDGVNLRCQFLEPPGLPLLPPTRLYQKHLGCLLHYTSPCSIPGSPGLGPCMHPRVGSHTRPSFGGSCQRPSRKGRRVVSRTWRSPGRKRRRSRRCCHGIRLTTALRSQGFSEPDLPLLPAAAGEFAVPSVRRHVQVSSGEHGNCSRDFHAVFPVSAHRDRTCVISTVVDTAQTASFRGGFKRQDLGRKVQRLPRTVPQEGWVPEPRLPVLPYHGVLAVAPDESTFLLSKTHGDVPYKGIVFLYQISPFGSTWSSHRQTHSVIHHSETQSST